jgi:hypothetical protein
LYDNEFKAQITPPLDDAPTLRPQFQPPEIATISLLDAQIMIEALRKSNTSLLSNLSPEQRVARPFLEVLAREMPAGIIIRLVEGNQILLSHHFVLAEKHRWIELNLDPRGELQSERFDQFELQFNWVQTFQIDQLIVTKMVSLVEKAA